MPSDSPQVLGVTDLRHVIVNSRQRRRDVSFPTSIASSARARAC